MKLNMFKPQARYRLRWLVALIVLSVILLSVLSGSGYILLAWLGWQIQTSVTVFLLLLLLLGVGLVYGMRVMQALWQKYQRNTPQPIHSLQQLQPFEQLGCLWLLNAKTSHQADLQAVFEQSNTLAPIVRAHLYRENEQYALAWQALNQNTPFQELIALEKIELLFAEKNDAQAFELLQLLSQQPASAFIESVASAWHGYLQVLWTKLAMRQPWMIFKAQPLPRFNPLQRWQWLQALEQQFVQSSLDQQIQLLQLYDELSAQPDFLSDLPSAQQWLFLLNLLPDEWQAEHENTSILPAGESISLLARRQVLADQLVQLEFNPRVLNIWMQSQMKLDTMECSYFVQRLHELAQRYPGQPSIALAEYHQWLASGQTDKAQAILQQWQQHADFSYLRLRQVLADQPELLADLDILYSAKS